MASENNLKDAALVLQDEIGERLLERLDLIRLKPAVILQIGLGTRLISDQLEKRYPKAIILNLDEAYEPLQIAKKSSRWRTRQRFVPVSNTRIPLADYSVDLIISNLAFHRISEWKTVLGELRRVLKPEGLLQFSTLGEGSYQEILENNLIVPSPLIKLLDLHDIGDLLLQARFMDPVIDMEKITFTYTKLPALLRDLASLAKNGLGYALSHNSEGSKNDITSQKEFTLTFEIVYGHAWAPRVTHENTTSSNEIRIPVHSLGRRK